MNIENPSKKGITLNIEHYKEIVENSPLYVLKIDREYKITYANQTFFNDFNFSKEKLIGLNAKELGYPSEIYEKWFQYYEKVFNSGQKEIFETRVESSGTTKFLKLFLMPEINEFGEVNSITIYLSNITDTKLIEDERDYIFNFSLDMFAIQTINGNFLNLNPSWNETLNWSSGKLIGANWLDFVHPEDLHRSQKMQSELQNYNLVVSHETRFQCFDGSYLWLEWNSIPIKNKEIVISVVRNITQWKAIKDKLTESENRYREVVETANYLLFSTDLKGNMLLMNTPVLKLTGYEEAELIGSNLLDLIASSNKDLVKSFYKTMIEEHQSSNIIEFPIVNKSGELIWLMQNAKLKVENNIPVRIDFIARDITIRKEAETKLRNSEKRLRSVVNSSNEILVVIDRNGCLQDANDTAYRVLDILNLNLMGKDFRHIISDMYSKEIVNNALKKGYNLDELDDEISISISDQKIMHFRIKGINYDDGEDNILLFLTNITEIRHAQKVTEVLYNISRASNLSEDLVELYEYVHTQLQTVVNAKNFAIAQIDSKNQQLVFPYFEDEKDKVFESIDMKDSTSLTCLVIEKRKALRLNESEIYSRIGDKTDIYGSVSKSWLGVPLIVDDSIFGVLIVQDYTLKDAYGEDDEKILGSVSEILASTISKLQYQDELKILNKDLELRVAERTIQLENTLENLNYENEERKKAQEELQKTQLELQASLENEKELHQMKSRFISMVSHEYRTPLTVIMSSVNLLKNYFTKMTQEQIDKQYKNISSSVFSMTNLLDDVLMIGKTENLNTINRIEFDLINSINAIVENIKFVDNSKHNFELNFPEKLKIISDKKLIDHIISNLVSNAVKYSEKQTTITINIQLDENTNLHIEVTDRGIGIPKDEIDKVFDSFYRSYNTGTIEGTGLGMSIVKKSVDTLGGTIKINSKLGVGTTVILDIPVKQNIE
ncbi:PAS domain S-box protein [bacterium]|nr:MAG: PAS domain S-box protein [bacterium]